MLRAMSVWVHELQPPPNPLDACARLEGLPCRLLLDDAPGSSCSYLMADPWHVQREGTLGALQESLAPFHAEPISGLPPFQGGAAGLIGYEWGAALRGVPLQPELELPPMHLGLYDWVIAWDHRAGRAWIVSSGIPEAGEAAALRARERGEDVLRRLRGPGPDGARTMPGEGASVPTGRPSEPASSPLQPSGPGEGSPLPRLRSSFEKVEYLAAIRALLGHIAAGELLQANLTQRFEAPRTGTFWEHYLRLRRRSPASFGAYLEIDDTAVMSISPESFLRLRGRRVETRPIKGTRPRGATPERDRALAAELLASAKEQEELRLVSEMARQELAPLCEDGSVSIPEPHRLESHPTVHHLVARVVGTLARGVGPADLLTATLPPASVTGLPKRRALEILATLEPVPRWAYCGTMLWWSRGGDLESSVLIRTMIGRGDRLYYAAGGGITAASEPEAEYGETLDKARAFLEAL